MKKLVLTLLCACFANFAMAGTNKTSDIKEDFLKCQHENKVQSCYDLAWLSFIDSMVLFSELENKYKKSCDDGNLDDCYDFVAITNGHIYDENATKTSKEILTSNCQKNHQPSCENLKNEKFQNKILTKNEKVDKLNFLYDMTYLNSIKGCSLGDENLCNMLKYWNYGKEEDKKMIIKSYDKGCKENNQTMCVLLANSYIDGFFIKKDLHKADAMLKELCDKDIAQACYNLYRTRVDINFVIRACELNDGHACIISSAFFQREKDFQKADFYLKKSCMDAKSPRGCYFMAEHLEDIDKTKYANEIKFYYDKACKMGDNKACKKGNNNE